MDRHAKKALEEFRLDLHSALDKLERTLSDAPQPTVQRVRDAKALETWELSGRLLGMRRDGLTQVQMARQLPPPNSKSYVCWLLRSRDRLDKTILDAWSEGHARATQSNLNQLAAIPSHAEQRREWSKLAEAKRSPKGGRRWRAAI
jgi:hypothetical protein